ncbi:EAL and GGDEF domain-containing protein [Oceanospirillum sp.]|uniref:sensor domain-containing protein n=1 Tax=Oceanospirillum sp. TaxID=2021254 RepID=UPI003A8D6FE8
MNRFVMSADASHLLEGVSQGMELIDTAFAHISLDQQLTVLSSNTQFKQMARQYHLPEAVLISWLKGSLFQTREELLSQLNKTSALTAEGRGHASDGKSFHFQWSLKRLSDSTALCFVRDIRWRQKYQDQWTLFERIFNSSRASVVVTDASNRIVLANKRFEEISGYPSAEVLGFNPGFFSSGRQDKAFYRNLWQSLINDGYWSGLIWNRRKDGQEYPEQKTIYTVLNEAGQITNYFSSGEVVLHNDAPSLVSSLAPGQSNSIMGQQGLTEALSRKLQNHQQPITVFYIGIDNMGRLNRHGGMALGDHIIRTTLQRLSETFLPDGYVARSVGDEFIIATPYITSPSQAESVAQGLLDTLQSSIEYQGIEWRSTVSIGISLLEQSQRPREAIEQSHIAMHHAKEQGGNSSHFFNSELQKIAKESVLLEQALHLALERNEFSLHYQPIVDTKTGQLVGSEALLRWNSEQFGFVPPDRFIPIAEHSGLIYELGHWVIEEVCQQINRWGESFTGSVAVNLSAHQLQYAGLAEQLMSVLNKYQVPVERVSLEITETAMIQDANSAVSVVADLKEAGFMLSIDDFGTGYSSLSYLTRFQLDKLKVDRCFVQKMTEQPQERLVTKAIVQLAKSLGMQIVAEGVETQEQRSALKALECDYLQGYLISKPLPANEFDLFVTNLTRAGLVECFASLPEAVESII